MAHSAAPRGGASVFLEGRAVVPAFSWKAPRWCQRFLGRRYNDVRDCLQANEIRGSRIGESVGHLVEDVMVATLQTNWVANKAATFMR
jgi:hypothetical protein